MTTDTDNKKNNCVYCGEAPVNHRLLYLENLISPAFNASMAWTIVLAPAFLKEFTNWVPSFLYRTLTFFGFAHFSSDIAGVASWRSRVIWEEAMRRGIHMEQIHIGKRPLDWYRARLPDGMIYFESIPIQTQFLFSEKDWDSKMVMKQEFSKQGIPVPKYRGISPFSFKTPEVLFATFETPVIVKPQIGSRGRHTVTSIRTLEDFKKGLQLVRQISPYIIVEEHLEGYICRATLIDGKLAGFYRGEPPSVVGDGVQTIRDLIKEKNAKTELRYHIRQDKEFLDHIHRRGYQVDTILPRGTVITLSHRRGHFHGAHTREMPDEVHPSFVSILEKAAAIVGLSVIGFDCIIPDPTKDQSSQRWGIIECNTLPFIDMHYYAFEGTSRDIVGLIWDLWTK